MAQCIHDGTKVLLSSIALPEEAMLHYTIYSSTALDALAHIEAARRKLCSPSHRPSEQDLLSSPISTIHFQAGAPLLYVFNLLSSGDEPPAFALDELTRITTATIIVGMAVSERQLCGENHLPCTCNSPSRSGVDQTTKESHLAQKLFLDAVRDKLLDEICAASHGKGHIPAVRFHNGFVLLPPQRKSTEWTKQWAGGNAGMIFCEMQLHLTPTHILVQPLPCRLHTLAPLSLSADPAGAAILLAPYGTPAFYLSPHTADDPTTFEFAASLSQNGVCQSVNKDFARVFIPVRSAVRSVGVAMGEKAQDGGLMTVWPRALILRSMGRPGLSDFPNGILPAQTSVTGATPQTKVALARPAMMPNMTIASSLTSLSLQAPVTIKALSSAMGAFVDATMKERERPLRSSALQAAGSASLPPKPQVTQAPLESPVLDIPPASAQLPLRPGATVPSGAAPVPAGAQSYPSPLEMTTARAEPSRGQPPPSTDDDAPMTLADTNGPIDLEPPLPIVPVVVPDEPTSQAAYPTSQTLPEQPETNSWDLGFGVNDGGFGAFGGGVGNMSFNPFSAEIFTEDDFGMFDAPVPAAAVPAHDHGSSAEMGRVQEGNPTDGAGASAGAGAGAGALPEMMLALSGHAQGEFGKLDTSILDWNMNDQGASAAAAFHIVGESGARDAVNAFSAGGFDLSTFQNDPRLFSLLEKAHPDIPLDGTDVVPSVQLQLLPQVDGNTTLEEENEGEEEEHVGNSGFSALRFGKDHNLADEKYYNGKYSLPSPPPEVPPPLQAIKISSSSSLLASAEHPVYLAVPIKSDSTKYSKAVGALSSPLNASTAREGDLRARYVAATHPSRAMLYKLAGTKRFWEVASGGPSTPTGPSGSGNDSPVEGAEVSSESPSKKRRLTWSTFNEAWRNPTPPAEDSEDDDDDGDSSMGGNDDWNDGFGGAMDGVELTLPVGPKPDGTQQQQQQRHESPIKLLQARFDTLWITAHDLAPPADICLPPAAASSSLLSPYRSNALLVPMSVPTPVSPEAQPSSNEPVRLATNMASRFAKEAGRNPLWNAVVVAMREIGPLGVRVRRELWQIEVDVVVHALQRCTPAQWGKSIAEIAESEDDSPVSSPMASKSSHPTPEHIHLLQSPKIHLGHGTNVIEALPSITRFWHQLNVTPLNGSKDVHCVALIPDTGGIRQQEQAEEWLKKLSKTYAARRFGTHTPVPLEANPKGIATVKWEKLRPTCNTLVRAAKDTLSKPLIVYVIVPNTFANLSHPSAMQVLNIIAEFSSPRIATPGTVLFMLIPEVFLSHSRSLSQNANFGMERLALTVYDSFPRTVFRQHSRLSAKKNGADETFDAYAFVLASRRPPKEMFVEKWPPPTASMFDRYTFLHVAYNITSNGEWVVASLVTETGDDLESQVWRVDEQDAFNSIVRNVLDFVLKHAMRADVEWRITLSKSGIMSLPELNAWTSELGSRVKEVQQPMHLTLLSLSSGDAPVFVDAPKLEQIPVGSYIPARSENSKDGTLFVDASSDAFLVFPRPVNMLPSSVDAITNAEYLSSRKEDVPTDSLATPIMTCWLIHVFRRPEWTQRQDASLSLTASSSSISSGQIHALHLVRFGSSTYRAETEEHMLNIATNFHDLTILHEIRTGFIGGETASKQPLHVAVVNSMTAALEGLQL